MLTPLRSARTLVAAAALVVSASAGAQSSRGDQREAPEVKKVALQGVKVVDKEELQKSIATEASGCKGLLFTPFCLFTKSHYFYERRYLDQTEFKRDVLRIKVFYWKRGYRDTKVDTSVVADGQKAVRVAFKINEGEPTRIAVLRVERPGSLLTDRQLNRQVRIRAGQPLNLLRLDSTIVRLRDQLWEQGYSDAVIDTTVVVSPETHSARVEIAIDPRWRATVGQIAIEGNKKVGRRTILNSLSFRPGDVYRRSDLLESQRNLYESNLFKQAVITVPPQGDTSKFIQVTVREAPLRDARISAGFNTIDFFQVEGRFTNFNFYGRARRLDIQGVLGNLLSRQLNGAAIFRETINEKDENAAAFFQPTWNVSADIKQPWFQSSRNTIGLGVFGHRRSAPSIVIDRGFGTSATFTRTVAIRAPASLTYRYEITRVEAGDVYFCVNYGVCDTPTIGALRRNQALSPLALTSSIDRGNDPFSPTTGYNARLDLEHASAFTGSVFRYNRAFSEGAVYRRMGGRRATLAAHARLGWVRPLESTSGAAGISDTLGGILHPRKRFYAGGSQSVRGYGENQLGPRILTVPASRLATISGCDSTAGFLGCNPNGLRPPDPTQPGATGERLPDRDFTPRALGGTTLIEGSVEYRFPVWKQLDGAVFVDGAVVGESSLADATKGTGAITPGFGVRYQSPVGPIRVDVGFNPHLAEALDVVTEVTNANGQRQLVRVLRTDPGTGKLVPSQRTYNSDRASFLDRLTLHLSIGQAF
jgi:outer membrane protein insertion porin family/translocation and assembly module TamA